MNTLQFILEKFKIDYKGCKCGHLRESHNHEVKECFCGCEQYARHVPIDIPNFGRDQLPWLFRELGFNVGAEIGVHKGEYSEVLCRNHPGLHLYCVDAWKEYKGYGLGDQKTMDTWYGETVERLKGHHCSFVRQFSMEAAKIFEDGSLDFVYIDAAHDFVNVVNDLHAWIPKVKIGGIISGHDYIQRGMGPKVFGRHNKTFHVKEALDAYTLAYHIDPWFLLGRKEPIEGEIRDKIRSFMWVKEW